MVARQARIWRRWRIELRADLNRSKRRTECRPGDAEAEPRGGADNRTTELVEAQQATKAQLDALAPARPRSRSSSSRPARSSSPPATRPTRPPRPRSTRPLRQRSSASTRRSSSARPTRSSRRAEGRGPRLQLDATLEAERERLKDEAEGGKDDVRKARDEINRIQPGDAARDVARRLNYRDLDRKYGTGVRGGARLFGAGMGAEAVRELISADGARRARPARCTARSGPRPASAARRRSSGCA